MNNSQKELDQFRNLQERLNFKLESKVNWKISFPDCSKQVDLDSCGVFVCFFALQKINNRPLTQDFDPGLFRKEIYNDIAQNCLKNNKYSPIINTNERCIRCHQKHSPG